MIRSLRVAAILAVICVCASFRSTEVRAAAVISGGGYSQNFDSLGTGHGDLSSLPGWSMVYFPGPGNTWGAPQWTDSTGIPAADLSNATTWDHATQGTTGIFPDPSFPTYTKNAGINSQHDAVSTTNRALGTSPTGFAGSAIQVQLTNTTGAAISNLAVNYQAIVLAAASAHNDLLGYRFFYSLTGLTGTWISEPGLNAITGDSDPAFSLQSLSKTINLASPLANNADIYLRWVDDNASQTSPDQMIAIDNVSAASVAAVPEPATILVWFATIVSAVLVKSYVGRRGQA